MSVLHTKQTIQHLNTFNFLSSIQYSVHDLEELLAAIRREIKQVSAQEQQGIFDLEVLSDYKIDLLRIERELTSPTPIKISFAEDGEFLKKPFSDVNKAEKVLLNIIMGFVCEEQTYS